MTRNVLVLCAGQASRWDRPSQKQLLQIDSETLLTRIARQFASSDNRFLVWHDREFPPIDGLVPFRAERAKWTCESLLSAESLWGDETIILLGDVYYTDLSADLIQREWAEPRVFTDTSDVFAVTWSKEVNQTIQRALQDAIRLAPTWEKGWNHGRLGVLFKLLTRDKACMKQWIDDRTQDFDLYSDYEHFLRGGTKNVLLLKQLARAAR